jgi:hypothetical protein
MIVGDEEESQQLMLVREADEGESANISRVPWNSEKSGSKQVKV